MSKWINRNLFRHYSIQQRLPLLICILLLSVMITFIWTSYLSVRKATLEISGERLHSLTDQLSSMLSQSGPANVATTRLVAEKDSVKSYLRTGNPDFKAGALAAIQKLRSDSSWVLSELLDINRQPVLHSSKDSAYHKVNFDSFLTTANFNDSIVAGKMYSAGDSVFYPVLIPVKDNNQPIGYLVRWRLANASTRGLDQIKRLMGSKSSLYVGNADGSLWTDLLRPVNIGKLDTGVINYFSASSGGETKRLIGAVRPIPNTRWLVTVGFPQQLVFETSKRYLNWIVIIGAILVTAGIFIAWMISRNITKPLNKLAIAASAIAAGDYSMKVEVQRNDELGKLAHAFNSMTTEVGKAKEDLEKKVLDRTAQLSAVNNELEAFAYSISHDLRAPLRGIIGFTNILEEEYSSKLDAEAKRITSIIKNNTIKMGDLIDDLLNFSRLNRQQITKTSVNTNKMVKEIIAELDHKNKEQHIQWIVADLPPVNANPETIKQVWINIISNAIKYSRNNARCRIEIGTLERKNELVFFVKDNGAGFNEKYKDKLFKVFQRLHGAAEFEGNGVGLAIAEKIITRHGGTVWAESELGKGACFYFSLPVE